MARQKEPAAVLSKKKEDGIAPKAFTKEVIAERAAQEVKVDLLDVKPPARLTKKQALEFMRIANMLLHVGIFTELDVGVLADYVIADELWQGALKSYNKAKDMMLPDIDKRAACICKFLDQKTKLGSKLGLNVMDRCRIVVPKEPSKENKFSKFLAVS